MNLNIKITKDLEEVAILVANSINEQLKLGKRVLWFVAGGSTISVLLKIADKINTDLGGKLVVTLTDERFGDENHSDSNWFQLMSSGFSIPNAKMIPYLKGKSFSETTKDIADIIKEEISIADYRIGIFGVGVDGHTAGILPHSKALNSGDFVCAYNTPTYDRITITPKAIESLDEAYIYAMGELKWSVIDKMKEDLSVENNPVLLLKKVPLLTIFTDYKK